MERVVTKDAVRAVAAEARSRGDRIALVPTMGALHDGHLSLVRRAREEADTVIVSVFVNPTQFAPGEDFDAYPRDLDRDVRLLAAEGVDAVFAPAPGTMYRPAAQVTVHAGPAGDVLEGAVRPGHFTGVCTVVTKLLAIVAPDVALFGEKDYQQLTIVRRMVDDLDLPVRVVGCPVIREPDGLALSSRNVYLSPAERAAAPVLYRALQAARALASDGEVDPGCIEAAMRAVFATEPLVTAEYAVVADAVTLEPLGSLDGRAARALAAGRVGTTRLIDNIALQGA